MEDSDLRKLLVEVRTIAVVGIKARDDEAAFRVPRYMQRQGYRILPVNPKLERILDEPAYGALGEIEGPVDLVNLFRAPAHIPAHVDEILALPDAPRAVWMQLGISHPAAAQRLAAAGIQVVEDRCLMVEHERLLGARA